MTTTSDAFEQPPKPRWVNPNLDLIPGELKCRRQWVITAPTLNGDGKWTKPPLQTNGKLASSTDGATWSDFEAIRKTVERHSDCMPGFVFTLADSYVGIDLDHCRDHESGKVATWAFDIVSAVNSYTEVSPSGTGIHIIAKGALPPDCRHKVTLQQFGEGAAIEVYDRGRYFALTGRAYKGHESVAERQSQLDALLARYFSAARQEERKNSATNDSARNAAANNNSAGPLDEQVLEQAHRARNGAHFTALYDRGDVSLHGNDESAADLALCSMLAFFTGPHEAQIDRLFRGSALIRPKWDSRRGEKNTYGAITIAKALEGKTEFFDWQRKAHGLVQHPRQDADTAEGIDGSVTSAGPEQRKAEDWAEPKDIAPKLLPVPPCDPVLIPDGFRPWLIDIADRMQCPLDYSAIAGLVSVSAIVGRQLAIRPKRHDDWQVIPNLWGGVVGPPSALKTPALSEGMAPLNELRRKAQNDHALELDNFQFDKLVTKACRDEISKALSTGAKGGKKLNKEQLLALREQYRETDQPEPTERRYISNDTTVEKLGELLNENPRGLLIYRDELTGFLKGLERGGHEQDRSFYLEAWSGDGMFSYDRVGRGTLHIDATCVSILGGIQPDPLRSYLLQTFVDGRNDGFIQRFQMLVYPDTAGEWRNVDRMPNAVARAQADKIFTFLDRLDLATIGAATPPEARLPYVRFTDEAQEFFDQWRTELENRVRNPEEAPVMAAHLAKFRSLMPSLALLFWLIDGFEGFEGTDTRHPGRDERVVSLRAAELAAGWCDYLEAHARRVFQTVTLRHRAVAGSLAKKIKDGKLPNPFTARQVYNSDWADLSNPEDVIHALEVLEDAGWVELFEVKNASGGRPKVQVYINPKLIKVPA